MSEIMDSIKMLVEIKGDKVENGSPVCEEYQKTHKNCFGCMFELGCSKYIAIGLTILASNEFNAGMIQETLDNILSVLSAKTSEELRKVNIEGD